MMPDQKKFLDDVCSFAHPSDAELEEMLACDSRHKLSSQPEEVQEIRIQEGKER